jgi:hypothetical protein
MIDTRLLRSGFAALLTTLAVLLAAPLASAAEPAGNTVRPEVGKPLQAAESLYKSKRYKEALAKVAEAGAAANKTPYEIYVIERTHGSIAAAAGDYVGAAKAFEAVVASGRATGAEQLRMIQAVAGLYYNAKDYAKAAQWAARYQKEGGNDAATRSIQVQSYFLMNDCGSVSKIVGDGDGGRRATEQELQILANCFLKQKDSTGYVNALERLVASYPKKEYWTDLLNRVQKKSGFSDRLSLDVYRLKLATGNITSANDYLEMTQLAIQGGFPAEAKAIVDKGYAAKALGTGKDAERHERLRALTLKTLADYTKGRDQAEKVAQADKSGDALVTIGYNYVAEGAPQKGLAYMEQGIKKGNLRRPEDAKLLLGVAQLQAGSRSRGVQTLRTVHGNDGTADLARLWMLIGSRS